MKLKWQKEKMAAMTKLIRNDISHLRKQSSYGYANHLSRIDTAWNFSIWLLSWQIKLSSMDSAVK